VGRATRSAPPMRRVAGQEGGQGDVRPVEPSRRPLRRRHAARPAVRVGYRRRDVTALYRKYRSAVLADLIGQEHIVRT